MQYSKGILPLGLSELYRFGIELEAFNVNTSIVLGNNPKSLYYSKESKEFLKAHRWKTANFLEESLVGQGGAELVSPILYDKEEDWQNLQEVCNHMQKYPGKHGDRVVADSKCGCHIHFDKRTLEGKTEEQSQAILKSFLRLWAESEELIYKMCNDVGNPIREGSLAVKAKGIHKLAEKLQGIKGMAVPSGKRILQEIQQGTLKVSYKKFGTLKRTLAKAKLDNRRYEGLNLTNLGNPDKNTIEFRISNGTLNPEVIKQNIFLYASLIQTARRSILEPEKVQENLQEFYQTDVTEEQKVGRLLNLLFENEQDRNIYRQRWESVRNAEVFKDNDKRGFAPNRFKREEFKQIAQKTPLQKVKEAFSKIKEMVQEKKKTKDIQKESEI